MGEESQVQEKLSASTFQIFRSPKKATST